MFVSVGQSPRTELVDSVMRDVGMPVEAHEIGALDGLDEEAIDDLRPLPGEARIITVLRNGESIVLSKPRIADRMSRIVANLPSGAYDLVVILTTGLFRDFQSSCPTVNTQRVMEATVMSLAFRGDAIGLIQPLEDQVDELDIPALGLFQITATHAQNANRASLASALLDLAECEIIVLNSVSFDEEDRQTVAKASGKPVILARRLVAGAIRLLLGRPYPPPQPGASQDFTDKLMRLTPREKQVLSLVAEGLSNKAVARQLGISPKTVEIHRANVMNKMEVSSVGALIRLVVSSGQF